MMFQTPILPDGVGKLGPFYPALVVPDKAG